MGDSIGGRSVLVGTTGFVGGNLARSHAFDLGVHSSDIDAAYDSHPGLLVYAGVPSAMFLANSNPEADLAVMASARENIRRIGADKVVLISTIAVYDDSRGRDETDSPENSATLPAYGRNRLTLERWVREDFPEAIIVRLPALYGPGLRKNFIHDIKHPTPQMLTPERHAKVKSESETIAALYEDDGQGWFRLSRTADLAKSDAWFDGNPLGALSFTDSRSRFQFYGLENLWDDIRLGIDAGWDVLNVATPPVSAGEVYQFLKERTWVNEVADAPYDYDMRTTHSTDGSGYLCGLSDEMCGIAEFVGRDW